ncbi:30S ribosomal protein S18 [Patescibacteria group bacterium]|nr:30S ribosomal protein S18 [Patescibacteria group bacterium]
MSARLHKLGKLIKKKSLAKCLFCTDGLTPDYKDIARLKRFMTPRKRIIPRSESGLCVRHQRQLSLAINRARQMAML